MSPGDDDWFDALAGRAAEGGDDAARREGALLRQALRRWPASVPTLLPHPEALLLAKAQRAGVTARRRWCPACAERWRAWRARPAAWAGAGLVLAAVLGLWIVVRPPAAPDEEMPVWRAPADGVQIVRSGDPVAARDRLVQRLAALNIGARRYDRLGRAGLDADLPQPLPAPLRQLLRDEGLGVAADGSLRVEFEAAR